ncbi:MAG: aminopeptidase, partial [Chloroflexi bacterium]|nr:aminopeptidase [Chloroflexota bacterium]
MFDDFAPKLAKVLTEYSQPVNPGDTVTIYGAADAMPLVEALYEAVLRRGGHPTVELRYSQLQEMFYRHANDDQLAYLPPQAMTWIEQTDIMYNLKAERNPLSLTNVPTEKRAKAREALRPFTEAYFRRFGDGSLRWTIAAWPTEGLAQLAEMGLLDYTEFIYKACALDQDDPVQHWLAFKARQDKLVQWMNGKKHCEVRGPGIEIDFDFTDRLWVNAHGDLNMPDGEIYTGPVEESVNGHVEFSYPTVYLNRQVSGVKLTFKDGVVVEASAEKGEDYLLAQLDLDAGARRLGEFAIGTNTGIQQVTGDTLFDEKIGGTIHMA